MIAVGSDKTPLAALAVLDSAVSAPFAKQERKTGRISVRSRHDHPMPSWQQREQQAGSPQHSPHVSVPCPSYL